MSVDSKIIKVKARAVPVPGDDIDTDRIMPARFLRCVTFADLGGHTFEDERFDPQGKPKTHPFNEEKYKGAGVLIVGKNFGCGSSREHAPQGILRWGIKVIIGESFAEIFAGNCTAIGLPAVTMGEKDIKDLMAFAQANPQAEVEVDLEKKQVSYGGKTAPVEMRDAFRKVFLDGSWDSAATLLAANDAIEATSRRLPYTSWFRAHRATA